MGRETGTPRRAVRLCGGVLAVGVLVTGCWGGAGEGEGDGAREPSGAARSSASAEPSPSGEPSASADPSQRFLDFVPDPERRPENRAEALKLARKVIARPEDWGAGYERNPGYKGSPQRSAELGKDCVWAQRPLSDGDFVSIGRRGELPARGDAGPLRVTAVVTVHRTEESARWEMARTLEEPLRCPDQRLNGTERVTGLRSGGDLDPDTSGATDYLQESGQVHSELPGSPHPYIWDVFRMGSVTLAVAVNGSDGHTAAEVFAVGAKTVGHMSARVVTELGVRK
ncbi:hypothetical protein RCO28_29540 [Streptomyces sp. LHD-70]|uniref:hypothetical protein n=1 Tax=Streptomyces sp. LHD-70 TaxID=3072140 RepID=UPI00280C3E98|nr:hypothetical protein [Streptomyces sp. LHD-70]MDQ8706586.1 hypothetical protein [Streptomyces sp. LHD-70]